MNKLQQRKKIRLSGYDYAEVGWYFVTICTKDRAMVFGEVISVGARHASPEKYEMKQNKWGLILFDVWNELPNHYMVLLDAWQVMPDHVHFIIGININGATGEACLAPTHTLGTIVGSFKSECTRRIRALTNNQLLQLWQRGFYDHVIRDDDDLSRIRYYIEHNPENWNVNK